MHEPWQTWLPVPFPGRWNWSGAVLQAPLSSYWHVCHCVMSRLKTLCISLVWVIFQWANLAGLIFSSFFSSWLLWSEEHQCQHRPWAQLCLIWHEAVPAASSQLRADLVTAGEDGEGKGWGMLLPLRAQAALKPVGLLEYIQSDMCLVLDWVHKTWAKWSYKSCTRMCAHVFFSRFVSLYCPRFLILAVEVALCGPVLCILWKAVMEEERMSIKSIVRLFPCCCHYVLITSYVSFQLSER